MKNVHKIFGDWNDIQIIILEKYGIKVEEGYDSFVLEENEIFWELKPYLDKWQVSDTITSTFSDEDLNTAQRLVISGVWANGYPMPDNNAGYLTTTYDEKDYCKECGIGLVQKEPFRLKKESNWGNKKMFSLNWVFDELFVRKDFYQDILSKYGIESMPVLLYKKETIIEDTLQLKIQMTEASLKLDGYNYEICKTCGRKRYDLINAGFFPPFVDDVSGLHIFKSREYFGTGANARKYIFLSDKLRREFVKHKVKANYIPCT
jgi:hypothetical protein